MNFRVGDQVVCIDAKRIPLCSETGLKAGIQYTVLAIVSCPLGTLVAVDDYYGRGETLCYCGTVHAGNYYPWRFIKIAGVKQTREVEEGVAA